MYSIKLPLDQGDLLLTPQWTGLPSALQGALILLTCLAPLALIGWLYRYELRLVSRLTALGLLLLRLTVVILLLLLVYLQPVFARTRTERLPGRVLVAVDRSESTDVADPQRTPAEKLRLARALHLAADLCPDELLDGWAADYEGKGTPQWVRPDEHKDDPERRRRLEAERRRAHDQVCARVDRLTRAEASRKVLGDDGVRLLSALAAAGHRVELVGFHKDTVEIPGGDLDELFRKEPAPFEKAKEGNDRQPPPWQDSAAAFTDLRLPLARALETSGPAENQVLGVVLLTDGLHNTGDSPAAKAKELGERRLPVYPVALGARKPPPDAAVVSIHAPAAVFKNVEAPVEVRFTINGMKSQDFVIELHREGAQRKLLGRRVLHHDSKDRSYTETFPVQLEEVGTQVLTGSVRPADPKVTETRSDNNSRLTTLNVADDKAKVLLIDGEARWEYHYLVTALKRDKTLQVRSVVFQQPRLDDRLTPEELEKMGSPRQSLPVGADALSEYDCIVLGDVTPEQFSPAERSRLEKYVTERGGTLVVVAGKRAMPLAFPEYAANGQADPLHKLLPVEAPRMVTSRDGFPLTLTQSGRESRFLELSSEPAKNEETWAGLQRPCWGVVGQAKPGATVLLWHPTDEGKPGPERERKTALVAWQYYGLGRVLFVGLDSTWRWRFKVGDLYHHAFWGATIRWAAADKPLMAGNEFLRFGTPQPVYSRDDEVKVVVRFNEEMGPVKSDLLAGARILALGTTGEKEKAVALVPLARREAQPRVLEGKISGLAPGQYAVELVIPDLANKLRAPPPPPGSPEAGQPPKPLRAGFTVRSPDSLELLELQTRWPLLDEIAAKSGGKVFTPEDAAELVKLLAAKSIPHVERHEQRLWQWWGLLAVVLGLLTVEWAARKLAGLP
jgi:hypothetical protein